MTDHQSLLNKQAKKIEIVFNGLTFIIEQNSLAVNADNSILITCGNSVILTTLVCATPTETKDYFPLSVNFDEKFYAVGRVPGGFFKREGKPGDHAVLSARLIDRAMRPMFDERCRKEVQIINSVLSVDKQYDIRLLAFMASFLVIATTNLPFKALLGAVKIGQVDGQLIVNPDQTQMLSSTLELFVVGSVDKVVMIEAGSKEISEAVYLDAITLAQQAIKKYINHQMDIIQQLTMINIDAQINDYQYHQSIINQVTKLFTADVQQTIHDVIFNQTDLHKATLNTLKATITKNILSQIVCTNLQETKVVIDVVKQLFDQSFQTALRSKIMTTKTRLNGRQLDQLRPLTSVGDVLPSVHGSALFARGDTKVLSAATIVSLTDRQTIDDLSDTTEKTFIHHYNFAGFSVGEITKNRAINRRETGHGLLVEKALSAVLPDNELFPYTIRIVSEVLSSDGSTSQAAICASSLALMLAGAPITKHIAGISVGLIKVGDDYQLLLDIEGKEDFFGDMDFKIAGTEVGICAIQLDLKIDGIEYDIIKASLLLAKQGRTEILENMNKIISKPRPGVSKDVDKVKCITVPTTRIKNIIGSGGKNINRIIKDCNNVRINVNDDGKVYVYHQDETYIDMAIAKIEECSVIMKVGMQAQGKVVKKNNFGIIVHLPNGVGGLIFFDKKNAAENTKIDSMLDVDDEVLVEVGHIDERERISFKFLEKIT